MSPRRSTDDLRRELQQVETLIAAHPLASPRIRAAHDLIRRSRARSADDVDRELVDGGLPGAAELGRAQLSGTWSWWRLHRRKRALERRMRRRGAV